ncbi:hypothetical protein HOC80_01915 [archaeon]|jgi:diaminohydroxyphosphoribosylaminopyrimidine deaminase / 5-amino-6-(5-phosphoribosylamino)uracil reductase|nr:hypothetical protein [archaeon]MBT4416838.1 hypothetical protein [archaeon]
MNYTAEEIGQYMAHCIGLAKQAKGVRKPLVGALVLSPDGNIVGVGYKKFIPGTSMIIHAERVALDNAGEDTIGGTLVTTLEPCLKMGRNQVLCSCSELLIEREIVTVVYGLPDRNCRSNSRSPHKYLGKRGIEVIADTAWSDRIWEQLH